MVEVLGFFLVLAALALMVGTLAQGPLRIAGFVVLAFFAVIASGPILQRTPLASFFNSGPSQTQSDSRAPADLPSSPVPAAPAYGGGGAQSSGATSGGANSARTSSTSRSSNRGIRGGW